MIRKTVVLLTLLSLLLPIFSILGQGNPFLKPAKKKSQTEKVEKTVEENVSTNLFASFNYRITVVQREMNRKVAKITRNLKENPSVTLILSAVLLAFLYGVLHALGPGHGKVFAVSYFMTKKAALPKGIAMGTLIAAAHSGSAIILSLALYFIFNHSFLRTMENAGTVMRMVSYAMIFAIGLFMIFKKVKSRGKDESAYDETSAGVVPMALSVGMVPCPVTSTLLIFSISIGALHIGLFLAAAIAGGMAVTISLIGVAAIFMRRKADIMTSEKTFFNSRVTDILEFAGAGMITIFGLILFISQI